MFLKTNGACQVYIRIFLAFDGTCHLLIGGATCGSISKSKVCRGQLTRQPLLVPSGPCTPENNEQMGSEAWFAIWTCNCGLSCRNFLNASIIFRAPPKTTTPHGPSDLLARNRLAMPTKVGVAPAQGLLKWRCQRMKCFHSTVAVVSCHTLRLCSKISGFLVKTTCLVSGLPKNLNLWPRYADSVVTGHNRYSY